MEPAEDPFRLAKRPAQMPPDSLYRRCAHFPVGFGDAENGGGGKPMVGAKPFQPAIGCAPGALPSGGGGIVFRGRRGGRAEISFLAVASIKDCADPRRPKRGTGNPVLEMNGESPAAAIELAAV